jgi:hypothetical protein
LFSDFSGDTYLKTENPFGGEMPHLEFFYVPPEEIAGDEIRFPPDEAKHIAVVLRHRVGDVVRAADGAGTVYEVTLVSVGRREVRGRILRSERGAGETALSVTLAAGVLKGERFDCAALSRFFPRGCPSEAIPPEKRNGGGKSRSRR